MEGDAGKVKTGGKIESAVVVREGNGCVDVEVLTGKNKGQVITVALDDFSVGQLPAEKQAAKVRRQN